jgi:hypothetical protein
MWPLFGTTEQAAEKLGITGKMAKNVPQGLKPIICFVAFAARLKPCPDTKPTQFRVFPQPVKSCPDTKRVNEYAL